MLTLFAEAMLLVVAAQAGFIDGPRVLANMAVDSWVPHRFASLSDRLTTQNGVLLMSGAALAALVYTGGQVGHLVVMHAINVFLTFSMSMFAMAILWGRRRGQDRRWLRRLLLFVAGLILCGTILLMTVLEKFREGGWITVAITALVVGLGLFTRRHYRRVTAQVDALYREVEDLPLGPGPAREPDPREPVAAVLVGEYGGVGIHTVLNIFRVFPGHFKGLVFLSVGVIDSGEFKGEDALAHLRMSTEDMLARYVALAVGLGLPATSTMALGTEVVAEAERLCLEVGREFPRATFFTGKLIFQRERWWHGVLHNNTALAIQDRLHWSGKTLVTLPIRVREATA